MTKTSLLVCVLLAFQSCTQNQPATEESTDAKETIKKEITAAIDSIVTSGKIIGVGVAMANEKGVLYANGFGYADQAAQIPYTEHTIQHIASVSKTLIGIALLKAQELGKLQLDDPINNYLPFAVNHPAFQNDSITIRHLATHTSGINDTEQYMDHAWILIADQDLTNIRTDYPEQRLNPSDKDLPMEKYLQAYLTPNGTFFQADNFINYAPGERYNYSNIGCNINGISLRKSR